VTVDAGISVRVLTPELLGGPADLLVADLSFISLRTVVAALGGVVRDDGELLVMVKPQFEVGRAALPRTGVVTDPEQHIRAVREVARAAAGEGLVTLAVGASGLTGRDGNREDFLHLRRTGGARAPAVAARDTIEPALPGAVQHGRHPRGDHTGKG